MDLRTEVEDHTATVEWLADALEHARSRGQARVLDYLLSVADDVLFEMERARPSGR